MEIKRVAISNVNEIISMTVVHMDYKGQIAKRINEKMPLAQVKGFRKGAVPKDLVEKQYGKQIKREEIQKVIDLALERYIDSERLALLGKPLAIENENLDWSAEELTFEFEIGLVPAFELDLEAKNDIVKYVVTPDDKFIEDQVKYIERMYGNPVVAEVVEESSELKGVFSNQTEGIEKETKILLIDIKDPAVIAKFVGKKAGDVVQVNTKGLFKNDHLLMTHLGVGHDGIHSLAIDVDFSIASIESVEPAELNQELLDKLVGPGKITSVEGLKEIIKNDTTKQLAEESERRFSEDVVSFLVENTKFDLPEVFLKKWLQTVGEKKLTAEEAEEEYKRSEKGLRYQLIEGKALSQNDIKVTFDDLKDFTSANIRMQMAQVGMTDASDEDVEGYVKKILSDKTEVQKVSNQVVLVKLQELFKEKVNATVKEVTYEEFANSAC